IHRKQGARVEKVRYDRSAEKRDGGSVALNQTGECVRIRRDTAPPFEQICKYEKLNATCYCYGCDPPWARRPSKEQAAEKYVNQETSVNNGSRPPESRITTL